MTRKGAVVASTADLTEQNLAEACARGGRPIVEKLVVSADLQDRAYLVLNGPDALFAGAELVVKPDLPAGTWAVVV